jgi:malonyl-CoA/methylmalonyl-CoA synthetase
LNVYPREIEQALDAVPGVYESAVIGVPHADMGEGVVAALVAEDGPVKEATLEAALSGLARFKRPRKFFWLDALPRNAMGKVQKQELRARYRDAFAPPPD